MVPASILIAALHKSPVLAPDQMAALERLHARFPEARALLRDLLRRGWLTAYQARQLVLGNGPGLILGDYVLVDRIGAGATSEVFKARDLRSGGLVSLKVLYDGDRAGHDGLRCLEHEARTGIHLAHPNIIQVRGLTQAGARHFLVMEYVAGCNLFRVVGRQGPLPVDRACDYARQACLGLHYLSECSLVHRDIKPSNLLLESPGGAIKILDLGIACSGQGEEAVAVQGTPDYIAPEQTRARTRIDTRTDLYSLGCTLYFLLTGRPPFPGGTHEEKMACHRGAEPEALRCLRPDTPPEVAAAVARMMSKRPEDRPPSAGAAAQALSPFARAGSCDDHFVLLLEGQDLTGLDPEEKTIVLP